MIVVIVLVIVFSVLHSLTADHRVKDWVATQVGERVYEGWYRIVYNAVSVLTLAPIFLAMLLAESTIVYSIEGGLRVVFLAVQGIGFIGLVISLLQIDWMRFAGLSQVLAYVHGQKLPLPPEPLQTRGVYGLVRHPLYFFSLLVLWFLPIMTSTSLAFSISATAYFLVGSLIEERRMLHYFGGEYEAYMQRVPWMLPLSRW